MSRWRLSVLPLYQVRVPGPEVFFQRDFDRQVLLGIHAFLLESDDGTLLIDTGLPEDHTALNADLRSRKGPWSGFETIGPPLASQLSIRSASSPRAILLTSFGPYATGGLGLFSDCPIRVSARGLADLDTPEELALGHRPTSEVAAELRARAVAVPANGTVANGVRLIGCGLHHPASSVVMVDTTIGRIAIADPVFHSENLTRGIALGAAEHVAGWHAFVRSLAANCDAILPIHDPMPEPVPPGDWAECLATEHMT